MISSFLHKMKRVALWLLILVVCLAVQLCLLEGILRWAGFGQTTRFLLRKEVDGAAYYVPNRAFYQQFTSLPLDRIMTWDDLDFRVPEKKASGAYRIFVFGSSAIYGPRTSARILETMLKARFPEIGWEVYNTACPGMNSHVMRAAARACRTLQPDLYLVYMGNNEAVGPFGPTTALGRMGPLWRPAVIRALIAFNDLRVSQLLRATKAMVSVNLPDANALMGMMPSMTDHYRALLYYRSNVEDICASAERAGAKVALCTLSSNKRFMGNVNPDEPDFNGLSINGILRDLAGRLPRGRLADVDSTLREHSQDGLPGYEYFFDNVHFNFDGNYLAADTMLEAVTSLAVPDATASGGGPLLSRDACAQRLAWTDAAEFDLLWWQMQAFQDDFTRTRTRERYDTLHQRLGDTWKDQLARDYVTALDAVPENPYLRNACFRLCLELGQYGNADTQQQEFLARHPAARAALRAPALLADRQGDKDTALTAYRRCLALYPDDPEALKGLGEVLFAREEAQEALRCFRGYLRANPDDAFAWCRIGQLQKMQGDLKNARKTYEMIIESAPKHPLAHRLLDELFAETLPMEARAAYWDAMMEKHPEAAEACLRRGLLYAQSGDGVKALLLLLHAAELAPDDPAVQHELGKTAHVHGAWDVAEKALREAIRLQPADGGNRLLLLQTLVATGDLPAAKQALAECDALGMTMPPELRQQISAP